MVLCAALWQASFLRMYRTMSKTPNFMLKYELRAYAYIYISSLGSYLRVTYVSSGMMNEWKSNFGAVGGWTNVCIPCLISLLNA